ncbi:hypothetical protein VP01_1367g5 [Puccinia sorghi]|uniref:Uncharacterized protein n=1 Tax=Puccinia sorghi TaxID=27349 RepID=A0A0L6VLZ0_9BASI|nr:hypothetical protein VP01_1367g5 [Puccinia sorghi]
MPEVTSSHWNRGTSHFRRKCVYNRISLWPLEETKINQIISLNSECWPTVSSSSFKFLLASPLYLKTLCEWNPLIKGMSMVCSWFQVPTKLSSKLPVCIFRCFGTETVHHRLAESLLEKGCSNYRCFQGVCACQLQAVEQVLFAVQCEIYLGGRLQADQPTVASWRSTPSWQTRIRVSWKLPSKPLCQYIFITNSHTLMTFPCLMAQNNHNLNQGLFIIGNVIYSLDDCMGCSPRPGYIFPGHFGELGQSGRKWQCCVEVPRIWLKCMAITAGRNGTNAGGLGGTAMVDKMFSAGGKKYRIFINFNRTNINACKSQVKGGPLYIILCSEGSRGIKQLKICKGNHDDKKKAFSMKGEWVLQKSGPVAVWLRGGICEEIVECKGKKNITIIF